MDSGKKIVSGYECFTDKDFDEFIKEADSAEGWEEAYRSDTQVVWWMKATKGSSINPVKVWTCFKGVDPKTLYDCLHDAEYRAVWDDNMIEGKIIQQLDPTNEIGYYSAKAPSPVANRDFVNLRGWRARPDSEYLICNHSVEHKDMPEKKNFVRAWSIRTGYLIRKHEVGCQMVYYTQSDPKGWFPGWLINMMTTKFAPKLLEKLYQAALKYPEWKKTHNPDKRPWEQTVAK